MRRAQILARLKELLPDLRARYGVESIRLFGSLARDEGRPDSDVDLLAEFRKPIGLFGLIELEEHLEHALGCKVDIGTARSLKPRIRERVLAEALDVA